MPPLSSSEVRARYDQIERTNEADFQGLLQRLEPDHRFSPFHRFSGPLAEQDAKRVWNGLVAHAHRLAHKIYERWLGFDQWRGGGPTDRQEQARRFIDSRLEKCKAWFNRLIAEHNAKPTVAAGAASSVPPSASVKQEGGERQGLSAPGDRRVAAATDTTAFRPAKEFVGNRFPTFKAVTNALKRNPWVRTRKPSKQRLEIHAGDWAKMLAESHEAAFGALDTDPETVRGFLKEAEETRSRIRRKKGR